MSTAAASGLRRIVAFLHRAEDAALALLLGAMVVLAPLQIFLRLFFDAGLPWAVSYTHLTLPTICSV